MTVDAALLLCLPATLLAVEIVFAMRFRAVAGEWISVMQSSTALMRDRSLDDDEKQARMAKASLNTMVGSVKLLLIIVAALAGFALVFVLGLRLFDPQNSVTTAVARFDVQIASVLVALVYLWLRANVRR